MHYLSRIWLNPLRAGAQRLLRSPQATHAAVLGGLPGGAADGRSLWRLEADGAHRAALWVLTTSRPSWEHVVEQAGWPAAEQQHAVVQPYDTLLERLEQGQEFSLRLRANPVSSTRRPDAPSVAQKERLAAPRARGVRVPHRTVQHQLDWLLTRTPGWGLEPVEGSLGQPQVEVVGRERVRFVRRSDGHSRQVVLQTATYAGRFRVTNVQAARTALLGGVGPGKAYGCGLITLAPVTPGP